MLFYLAECAFYWLRLRIEPTLLEYHESHERRRPSATQGEQGGQGGQAAQGATRGGTDAFADALKQLTLRGEEELAVDEEDLLLLKVSYYS